MNHYKRYLDFIDKSTSINRVLYSIHERWSQLSIPATYEDADNFNHLIMFLAQIIAFEAFVNRCLHDECRLTQRQIKNMRPIEVKMRRLLPGIDDDNTSGDISKINEAFALRNTWMHAGGDPTLTTGAQSDEMSGRKSVLVDILNEEFWKLKWIDEFIWTETASPLTRIASKIAERFGWIADA